ncbi:SAM-dependent methyltransferase [Marinobacter sp. ATCH36]|uniref:SAM-dependent methyltransferase n=1 Tax=Marinobacter sp. ATCH36 TaxID=2945106 RepID=UPI0020201C10|nr:nodulation S family protein [Marinobacter sp. ATCH36]
MTAQKYGSSPEFFERLYQEAEDPWNFRNSDYERQRYAAIVDNVRDRQYRSAFEPGCAIGELTVLLAPFCESLEAMDCSLTAVNTARHRCRDYPQVQVHQGALPEDLPVRRFDLIVFSELGYYFNRDDLASLVIQLWSKLEPGGRLIACHWLGHSDDHQLHGAEVHKIMARILQERGDLKDTDRGYALQRWGKGNDEHL